MNRISLVFALALAGGLAGCSSDSSDGSSGPSDAATGYDAFVPDTGGEDIVEEDTSNPFDTDFDGDAGAAPQIDRVTIVENPANPLSVFVEWSTDLEATGAIDVTCDGEEIGRVVGETAGTFHAGFVMNLLDGASCEAEISVVTATGATATLTEPFTAGSVPDYLPTPEVTVLDADAMQPGFTLHNLSNHFDGRPFVAVLTDPQGRTRWIWRANTAQAGSDNDTRVVDGGIMVGGTRGQVLPTEVAWDGTIVWQGDFGMHHHLQPIGDEGHVVYLRESDLCEDELAGEIVELDRETGEEVWTWRICDHYTPPIVRPDWSHLNTAEVSLNDTHFVVSSREQHTIFLVERETGDIVWSVGLYGTLDLEDDGYFWRQHAPRLIDDEGTRMLLFDNGQWGERTYSRALELAIDAEAGTAEVAWQYVADPEIFADIWSDADRLPNGNTLITYGLRSEENPSHQIEVTTDGTEVWHAVWPVKWGMYRSERVVPPTGYLRSE